MTIAGVFAATAALAASVHLKGGKKGQPVFTDNGTTLTASDALSGLGEGDVVVSIEATADADLTCFNPGQGGDIHIPPGSQPEVEVKGAFVLDPDEREKNGNTPFTVSTADLDLDDAPDCPNINWTEQANDLLFKTATITVEQPVGTIVLVVNCSFETPTEDGLVHKQEVTCTQSAP
jgi:hypothetical protein